MTGGNMYKWVQATWNPLAGECPHQCEYCYVKSLMRFPSLRGKYSGPVRIDKKALNSRLPRNATIFVCSMNDLFAEPVPDEYIKRILRRTHEQMESWGDLIRQTFLFQTKNPGRMIDFAAEFPECSIFATTIESNRGIIKTNAPSPEQRYRDFKRFKEGKQEDSACDTFEITIEPIVQFDRDVLLGWILGINPDRVNIGADSKRHNLPEPTKEDVLWLINELENNNILVNKKPNLKRILKEEM